MAAGFDRVRVFSTEPIGDLSDRANSCRSNSIGDIVAAASAQDVNGAGLLRRFRHAGDDRSRIGRRCAR